jgi:hypothetical protein
MGSWADEMEDIPVCKSIPIARNASPADNQPLAGMLNLSVETRELRIDQDCWHADYIRFPN